MKERNESAAKEECNFTYEELLQNGPAVIAGRTSGHFECDKYYQVLVRAFFMAILLSIAPPLVPSTEFNKEKKCTRKVMMVIVNDALDAARPFAAT